MTFWQKWSWWIVEGFIFTNISFLAVDIYIAHSINHFHHKAEWIPLILSLVAPCFLTFDLWRHKKTNGKCKYILGKIIGILAIATGVAGLMYHLQSQFFTNQTIKSLVYTAPFVAPLAYSGLGFLILLNRTICKNSVAWAKWIIFFAVGGFLGNFVLTLCDHAQNGFFHPTEWLPVISSAIAIGFLLAIITMKYNQQFTSLVLGALGLQVFIGLMGFTIHLKAVLNGPHVQLFNNIVYVAPVLAPLLFVNLAILGCIGVWDLSHKHKIAV